MQQQQQAIVNQNVLQLLINPHFVVVHLAKKNND